MAALNGNFVEIEGLLARGANINNLEKVMVGVAQVSCAVCSRALLPLIVFAQSLTCYRQDANSLSHIVRLFCPESCFTSTQPIMFDSGYELLCTHVARKCTQQAASISVDVG